MKIIDSHNRYSKYIKPAIQRCVYHRRNKNKLMIFGCQRSGTTLLTKVFDDLFYCSVYGETSVLSDQEEFQLRLNPIQDVIATLEKDKAPLIVMKPLMESQNALRLLENLSGARCLWMFRHPVDTISSMLSKFGDMEGAINKIKPIVDEEFAKNPWTPWITENVSLSTRDICKNFYSPNMNSFDAGLLFWYSRNILFFEQNLHENEHCMALSYEALVADPISEINRCLIFVGMPEIKTCRQVAVQSKSASDANPNPEIMALCDQLYARLLAAV